ncbi:MAG: hypothetical protein MR051_07340, partial [Lentisphaeria bacterium]|nr:hypothetical protein [Lentisphaeria bacterium]
MATVSGIKMYGPSENFNGAAVGDTIIDLAIHDETFSGTYEGNSVANGGVLMYGVNITSGPYTNGRGYVYDCYVTSTLLANAGGSYDIVDTLFDRATSGNALWSRGTTSDATTISGSTFLSGNNLYLENGNAVEFRGTNYLDSSATVHAVTGGTYRLADGAKLVFGNSGDISVADLTFLGGNTVTLAGTGKVAFAASENFSGVNITVDTTAFDTGRNSYTLATNLAGASVNDITVTGANSDQWNLSLSGNTLKAFHSRVIFGANMSGPASAFGGAAVGAAVSDYTIPGYDYVFDGIYRGTGLSFTSNAVTLVVGETRNCSYLGLTNPSIYVSDSVFTNTTQSTAAYGGMWSLRSGGATVVLLGTTVGGVGAQNAYSGGMLNITSGRVVLDKTLITGQTAMVGGAFQLEGGTNTTVEISNSTFSGNRATAGVSRGGAIESSAVITITDSEFATATDSINSSGSVTFKGTNTVNASLYGSGTYALSDGAALIFGNTAAVRVSDLTFSSGNAVTLAGTGKVTFADTEDLSGVNITVDTSAFDPASNYVTLAENFTGVEAADITVAGTGADQWNLALTGGTLKAVNARVITGVRMYGPSSAFGGVAVGTAVSDYTTAGCDAVFDGTYEGVASGAKWNGNMFNSGIPYLVIDSTFSYTSVGSNTSNGVYVSGSRITNSSQDNGKKNMYGGVWKLANGGTVYLINGTVSGDGSTANAYQGGMLYMNGGTANRIVIAGSLIQNNIAEIGGAMQLSGGAATVVEISNSTFSGNRATAGVSRGGAIESSAAVTITDSEFATATDSINSSGSLTFEGTNTVNASLYGSGTCTLSDGAALIFGNTAAVNVTGLTMSGNNAVTFDGSEAVNFASQDLSGVAVTVGTDVLPAAGMSFTIATGVTGMNDTITVNNSSVTLGEIFSYNDREYVFARSGNTFSVNEIGKFDDVFVAPSGTESIVIGGETISLAGKAVYTSLDDALVHMEDDGTVTVYNTTDSVLGTYAYFIGPQSVTGDMNIVADGMDYTRYYISGRDGLATEDFGNVSGDITFEFRNATTQRITLSGENKAHDLCQNAVITVKNAEVTGYIAAGGSGNACRIGGDITINLVDSRAAEVSATKGNPIGGRAVNINLSGSSAGTVGNATALTAAITVSVTGAAASTIDALSNVDDLVIGAGASVNFASQDLSGVVLTVDGSAYVSGDVTVATGVTGIGGYTLTGTDNAALFLKLDGTDLVMYERAADLKDGDAPV